MRIYVNKGKGRKERYTILPESSWKMLREYWSKYRQHKKGKKIFLNETGTEISEYVIRIHFRKYREKARLNKKVIMHTLRHGFATKIYKKKELPTPEILKKILGKDFNLCPNCKKGHMLILNTS